MKKILQFFLIVVISSNFYLYSNTQDHNEGEQQLNAMTIINSPEDDLIEGEY